jgi:hypothetical protein
MYSTVVYHYIPRQTVIVYTGTSNRRYQNVYAKNLKLHHGVDNRLQFQFLNQEQKKIDLTGKDITFRLISYDATKILLEKTLVGIFDANGLMEVQITADDISGIDSQYCHYSIELPIDQFNLPVFVDDSSGARGVIEILDSVYPKFMPSKELIIPTHIVPLDPCNPSAYESSIMNTYGSNCATFQAYFEEFTGTMQFMASTLPDGVFYELSELFEYEAKTGTDSYIFNGHHPYIKMKFNALVGDVKKVYYR